MVQGMSRRHLFDNGYPVCVATLLAGSEVLLAVSRQAVRTSHFRLAMCVLRLRDTSQRLMATHARQDCSHVDLANSRENFTRLIHAFSAQAVTRVEVDAGQEPGERPACQTPDRP